MLTPSQLRRAAICCERDNMLALASDLRTEALEIERAEVELTAPFNVGLLLKRDIIDLVKEGKDAAACILLRRHNAHRSLRACLVYIRQIKYEYVDKVRRASGTEGL